MHEAVFDERVLDLFFYYFLSSLNCSGDSLEREDNNDGGVVLSLSDSCLILRSGNLDFLGKAISAHCSTKWVTFVLNIDNRKKWGTTLCSVSLGLASSSVSVRILPYAPLQKVYDLYPAQRFDIVW